MNDKSPRQQLSQKSGKSLKEKRAAKKVKQADQTEIVTPSTRKGGARVVSPEPAARRSKR